VRKIAQAETKGKESGSKWQKQRKGTTPKAMEKNKHTKSKSRRHADYMTAPITYHWASGLLVGLRGQGLKKHNTTSFTSVHIGIRQGATVLELGDLESVASPRSSPQLGGKIRIFSLFRFLY
jgi:hypothetical protein